MQVFFQIFSFQAIKKVNFFIRSRRFLIIYIYIILRASKKAALNCAKYTRFLPLAGLCGLGTPKILFLYKKCCIIIRIVIVYMQIFLIIYTLQAILYAKLFDKCSVKAVFLHEKGVYRRQCGHNGSANT